LNMIDREGTIKRAGYDPAMLSPGSHKKVLAICDNCGRVRWVQFKAYRDLCHLCACRTPEHRRKVSESKRGEKHPNWEKRGKGTPFWGRKHTLDTRRRMSESKKGRYLAEETKQKISEALKGRKLSEETRKKMSKLRKGRKLTPEWKEKIIKNIKDTMFKPGKEHPNWKGGISFEPYCEKFNEEYKESIRNQFGRVCVLCGKTEKENGARLSIHHVNYNKKCGCDGTDCVCVPLCRQCHGKTNYNQEYWEQRIMEVIGVK